MMVGRLLSYWEGTFSGAMLNFGRVPGCCDLVLMFSPGVFGLFVLFSKKSPTGPTERTPKPEYHIARSQLTSGSVGKVLFNFWWMFATSTDVAFMSSSYHPLPFTSWMSSLTPNGLDRLAPNDFSRPWGKTFFLASRIAMNPKSLS